MSSNGYDIDGIRIEKVLLCLDYKNIKFLGNSAKEQHAIHQVTNSGTPSKQYDTGFYGLSFFNFNSAEGALYYQISGGTSSDNSMYFVGCQWSGTKKRLGTFHGVKLSKMEQCKAWNGVSNPVLKNGSGGTNFAFVIGDTGVAETTRGFEFDKIWLEGWDADLHACFLIWNHTSERGTVSFRDMIPGDFNLTNIFHPNYNQQKSVSYVNSTTVQVVGEDCSSSFRDGYKVFFWGSDGAWYYSTLNGDSVYSGGNTTIVFNDARVPANIVKIVRAVDYTSTNPNPLVVRDGEGRQYQHSFYAAYDLWAGRKLGVGVDSQVEKLEVFTDSDVSGIIGRAHFGYMGFGNCAGFSHIDQDSTTSYALLQTASGITYINAAATHPIRFCIAHSDVAIINSIGNFGIGTESPGTKCDVVGGSIRTDNQLISTIATGTAPLNVASTTLVSNLNADYLDSKHETAFLLTDGSRALSGDWDIGASRKISAEAIYARSNLGLKLFEDGGTGIFVQDSTGYVGIGTTSPEYPLQVRRLGGAGSLGVTVDNVLGGLNRDVEFVVKPDSSSAVGGFLFVSHNGVLGDVNALSIKETGNVGIGTTSPDSKLHLSSSATTSDVMAQFFASGMADNNYIDLYLGKSRGTDLAGTISFVPKAVAANSYLQFGLYGTAGPLVVGKNNVGIGTTSPGKPLDVIGDIRSSSQLISTVTTGTAPLAVSSTTAVTNLNADLLDGNHAADFALLAGRAGGQTLIGGTGSGENLTLQSTSHATKGLIIFGSLAAYDEVNNRLGLGTTSPGTRLDLVTGNITARSLFSSATNDYTNISGGSGPNLGANMVCYGQSHATLANVILWRNATTNLMKLDGSANLSIGDIALGTSAAKVLGFEAGTAPTTAPANIGQMWVEDIDGAAGYAGLYKMTETTALKEIIPGVVVKATTGRSSNPYEGLIEINKYDNQAYIYADGGWRAITAGW
jgi:hypothetical protein